jgi:hypothetical protein
MRLNAVPFISGWQWTPMSLPEHLLTDTLTHLEELHKKNADLHDYLETQSHSVADTQDAVASIKANLTHIKSAGFLSDMSIFNFPPLMWISTILKWVGIVALVIAIYYVYTRKIRPITQNNRIRRLVQASSLSNLNDPIPLQPILRRASRVDAGVGLSNRASMADPEGTELDTVRYVPRHSVISLGGRASSLPRQTGSVHFEPDGNTDPTLPPYAASPLYPQDALAPHGFK